MIAAERFGYRIGSKEFLPQIIILDIALPDMNGWELARNLRQELDPIKPVVIVISGYPNDKAKSAEVGIDHYLAKPSFRKELMELLMKLVGRRDGS